MHGRKSNSWDKIPNMSVENIKTAIQTKNFGTLLPIFMMLGGVSLFAIADVFFKLMSADLHPITMAFWNDLFALAVVLIFARKLGGIKTTLQSSHKKTHIARSFCYTFGFFALLASFAYMPIANAYAILFLWPLIASILAILILKEHAYRHHWISLILGFIGIFMILKPGADGFDIYSLFPLASALFLAMGAVISRKIPETETHFSHAFYPILVTLIVSGVYVIFDFEMPTATHFIYFTIMGFLSGFGVMLVGMAFARGNTAVLSPFEYTKMFWAVVLGYLMFGDTLAPLTALGAALIIASGIYLVICEGRKKL